MTPEQWVRALYSKTMRELRKGGMVATSRATFCGRIVELVLAYPRVDAATVTKLWLLDGKSVSRANLEDALVQLLPLKPGGRKLAVTLPDDAWIALERVMLATGTTQAHAVAEALRAAGRAVNAKDGA